jgi:hypothetical protein
VGGISRDRRCAHGFGGETRGEDTTWYTWTWDDNIEMDLHKQGWGHELD